tara:strand:+ start:4240 stop:4632 length:393 start_codon:yes stop_codon:yes gene_type:complete
MSISIERQTDLIRLTVTGAVTTEDLYQGVDAIYEPTPDQPKPPKMVLWDLTDSQPPPAGDAAAHLRDFSIYAAERGQFRTDSRVAVLSPNQVQFGMARMSASLAELNQAAYSMGIFRDIESAMTWLKEGE